MLKKAQNNEENLVNTDNNQSDSNKESIPQGFNTTAAKQGAALHETAKRGAVASEAKSIITE